MQIDQDKKRRSLSRVFSSALTGLFAVFITLVGMTYYQLLVVSSALGTVAEKSIPIILQYEQVANHATSLIFQTERLSNSVTPPALRIAEKEINKEIEIIASLLLETQLDEVLIKEYQAITEELEELRELVTQQLISIKVVKEKEQQLYQIYDNARLFTDNPFQADRLVISDWILGYSRLFMIASEISNATTLNDIRQKSRSIDIEQAQLNNAIVDLPKDFQSEAKSLARDFSAVVLGEQGLVALSVNKLTMKARTNGRGNFTEKLVSDFTRSLRFQGTLLGEEILADANRAKEDSAQQIQILTVLFAIAVALLLLITWVLHRRVIRRLIMLKQIVSGEASLRPQDIKRIGNDEISDIAITFQKFSDTIEAQKHELTNLAMLDGLTGIANRRAFDLALLSEFNQAKRYSHPLSILLIDVDYFKPFNDLYGHSVGDDALKQIAATLRSTLKRDIDFVARYGGEEFVCILTNTDCQGALICAQNLREAVEKLQIEHAESKALGYVTVSIGGATQSSYESESDNPERLLKLADDALYDAKEFGRNQVRFPNNLID
ncbi:GGDEF domain-containing protein [Aliiglaciecola sp. LCG003]|uniref:GGDEF domain-containing protein n=1 Tax=Aliiglaciecola sp. LCG003 TaxID=3053655 RepID=UPI0025725DF4|nr:GGDEF domain-containing protein [Aliiglaciecola sp. LCG003]WJG10077.1 GGDEF domain-containing protein [Aliiglaciecola sp. LCG003]